MPSPLLLLHLSLWPLFHRRCRAPPSPHPSSSSSDRIFLFPPPQVLRRSASSSLSFSFLSSSFVFFVVFIPRAGRGIVYMRVRKNWRIWWICRDGSGTFRNRAAEVSLAAVRRGFDLFLMTPWMACQNPACYKNCAALAQASKRTREIFAAVTTRTSYSPMW